MMEEKTMNAKKYCRFIFVLFAGFLIVAASTPLLAAQGAGGSPQAGVSFKAADVSEASSSGEVKSRPVPKMYTEDVLRLKQQMQDSEAVDDLLPADAEDAEADGSAETGAAENDFVINAPVLSTNFAGISYTGWYPPDPIMAVGPSHVLVMVNSSLAVYNKTGGAPLIQKTLSSWFSSVNPGTTMIFDPKCVYDPWNQRFIVLALARNDTTQKSYYLLSVSKTNSAAGSWWSWKLDATKNGSTATTNWADYPQIGYDSSTSGAIYITSNQFAFGGGFQYSKLRILKKSQLYSGASLGWYDFWNYKNANGTAVFTWQPVQTTSGTTGEWLVNTVSASSGNQITLYKVSNPTATTPTLTRTGTFNVRSYTAPPDAKQKGGSELIDTGDCRLYNAVYKYGYIYTSTVEAYKWGDSTTESALRYLKLNTSGVSVTFDKTYGGNNSYYFYPAIDADTSSNIYLVFSRSSSTEYAGVRFSGRKTTDTAMQASAPLKAGEAYYVRKDGSGRNRWGDYSGIARDWSTGHIWVYGEYAKPSNQWGTWIGKTKF
jgi:hypothetical protein